VTPKAISAAAPGDVLHDDLVRGLQLRVNATGRKSFMLYYRTRSGVARRPKLGDASVLSLADARSLAREILARVAVGEDPSADWQKNREAPLVADVCEEWLEENARATKPRTQRENERLLARYILPRLGKDRITEVERDDIAAVHAALAKTPYQANRVLSVLSTVFNYAEKRQLRADHTNPCRHVEKYPEKKKRRYITDDEARRLAAVLAKYQTTNQRAVAFIRVLLFTGARPEEISRARPEWLRESGKGWVLDLPDSKTGARLVYLPDAAVAAFKSVEPADDGTFFGIQPPAKFWRKVREEAGFPDVRMYDLRHTFASAALRAGLSLPQIGGLLGHKQPATTARYAHLMEEAGIKTAAEAAAMVGRMLG